MLFEHWGDNRSFKTGGNALFAWLAYCQGRTVYFNCPISPFTGKYNCILNFPHEHVDRIDTRQPELQNCYLGTDQGETSGLDSLMTITKDARDAMYFGLQATKRDVDWHFDTVRHKSIVNKLRLAVHFYIQSIRYPSDPRKPLMAVKLRIKNRYSPIPKTVWILQPWKLFPLWNTEVLIHPKQTTPISQLPDIGSIHKQLVGP